MAKQSMIILGGTALVAIIVAAYLSQQLDAERELTARLLAAVSPTIGRQQSTNTFVSANAPDAPQADTAAPSGQPVVGGSAAMIACELSSEDRLLALMPTLRKYRRDKDRVEYRKQMAGDYPDVAKELGLTEAEADAFYATANKHKGELAAASYTGTNETFRSEAVHATSELERMHDDELEALLGPAKYRQWQEYVPTLAARLQVEEMRSWVAETHPLTDSQVKPFVAAAVGALQRAKDEAGRRRAASPGTALTFLQDQEIELSSGEAFTRYLLEDSRPLLSSQQYTAMSNAANQYFSGTRRNLEAAQRREAARPKP